MGLVLPKMLIKKKPFINRPLSIKKHSSLQITKKMMYNKTNINGVPMPLLMGYTKATINKPSLASKEPIIYDPVKQIVVWNMGSLHNTRSDRIVPGSKNGHTNDIKSINDDKKFY